MPPSPTDSKSRKPQQSLDLTSFERHLLKEETERGLALASLQRIVYFGDASQLTEDLLSKRHLYEYVFSIVDDDVAAILRKHLLDRNLPDEQTSSASPTTVLERISMFLYFLPYPSDDARPSSLSEDLRFVQSSREALSSLLTDQVGGVAIRQTDEYDDFPNPTKKKRSQKQAKQEKRQKFIMSVNPKPFKSLGEAVPTTKEEASSLARQLKNEQKKLLGRLLDTLREPSLSLLIHQQYLPQDSQVDRSPETDRKAETVVSSPEQAPGATSAFPLVQPLRAALYFDSAKDFGDWRVFISTKAEKGLRAHRKNPKIFGVIIKKIKELSHGHFSDDNQKRLKGPSNNVPIFEAKLTGDLRLVYQIDCISDYETDVEWQVLRVYGFFTHAQMDGRMWESLSTRLTSKGPEYKRRVTFRAKPLVPGDNVFPPQSWPSICGEESDVNDTISNVVRSDDLEEIHQWIVLEKYMAFSQALFNCIMANKDISPIFAVSPHEKEIIENTSSCYVIGRSGTGKTTTILFKIFGIERSALQQRVTHPSKPRQLFVTQSRVLADRVKEYYKNLTEFLNTATKSSEELAELLAGNQKDDLEQQNEELVDHDEEDEWRDDLPKRFSDLEDKHFPLFLTFDKLCRLLEADLGLSFARQKYTKEHKRAESRFTLDDIAEDTKGLDELGSDDEEPTYIESSVLSQAIDVVPASLVTFDVFKQHYWPHFPQNLTKRLDPALVLSEILGVIKGSEQTLTSAKPHLSREDYLNFSHRSQATFAMQRPRIYDLFERYQNLKRQRGDYDAADRTHSILARLNTEKLMLMDYLYVDEAQDNLLIDALLLRSLCRNSRGTFWAGDTAQTISIGSSFRFNELKAFMHRIEERLYEGQQAKLVTQPKLFQLTTNYRSHGGIVNCANTIVELITQFWPNAIDTLQRERGVVDGVNPIFLSGWDENTLRLEEFLFGESGSLVEFGAQQCILVRDDVARDELRKAVGQIGLILTLYESKGLEFDDVLLYNFFKDSSSDASQWRVVLNAINDDQADPAPQFDDTRHASINSELKSLYVAVTRARKNLWIADCSETSLPMRYLLLSRKQVDLRTPASMPALAVSSSPEQWAKAGRLFFRHKRYLQAMHCFQRAGLDIQRDIAEAYELRKKATGILVNTSTRHKRISAFRSAANTFSRCAEAISFSRTVYNRIAAECFVQAEDHSSAARAYMLADMFSQAAQHFRAAGMFDEAVAVVQTKKEHIDSQVVTSIINVSRLYYFKEHKIEKASKLFDSYEETLEFTKDYDLDVQQALLLEKMGYKAEAAEVHLSEGRWNKAIRLFLSDNANPRSARRAVQCILEALWNTSSFGIDHQVNELENPVDIEFIVLATQLNEKHLKPGDMEELRMFEAIRKDNLMLLPKLIAKLYYTHTNIPATLLALDRYFGFLQHLSLESVQEALSFLDHCHIYAKHLRNFYTDANACDNVDLQKLFGFQVTTNFEFIISSGTLLHTHVVKRRLDPCKVPRYYMVPRRYSTSLLMDAIAGHKGRLRQVVNKQLRFCTDSKLFATPCIRYLVNIRCNDTSCRREHIEPNHADIDWFNHRLQIFCLQIGFLKVIDFIPEIDLRKKQRECMTCIFEHLHPPIYTLGGMANISQDVIPNFMKTMKIFHAWVQGRSYDLRPGRDWFLNAVLEVSELALYFNPAGGLCIFIERSPFYVTPWPPALLRNNDPDAYVVRELVQSLAASDSLFITKGIFSLRYIIEAKQHINIAYVCHILEFLCGSIIFLHGYKERKMNDITMPKSWFATVLRRLTVRECDLRHTHVLIALLKDLIRQFMLEADAELSYLTGVSYLVKSICIHRLFRCLCLLGYNLRDWHIQGGILKFIIHLVRSEIEWRDLYKSFLLVSTWNDVARAVRNSTLGSNLDEMVQIVQEKISSSIAPLRNVKRLVFKDLPDIPMLFNAGFRKDSVFSSSLSVEDTSFTPQVTQPTPVDGNSRTEQGLAPEALEPVSAGPEEAIETHKGVEISDEDHEDDQDSEKSNEENSNGDSMEDPAITTSSAAPIPPTAEEIRAATTIQALFRARQVRRNVKPSSIDHEKRAHHFIAYLKKAKEVDWPRGSLYRLLFLGALPHVACCLDLLQGRIVKMKSNVKRQYKESTHHKLEEVNDQYTCVNKLMSEYRGLRKMAEPSSEFHGRRDLFELSKLVLDVQTLANRLNAEEVAQDMQLATKAIVYERKPAVSKLMQRPTLNTEDLSDEMY